MTQRSTAPLAEATAAFVAIAWLGMLTGVSFLATPVKFQAPSLVLPVALEVGHVTFAAFNKVEWVLALVLALAVFIPRISRAQAVLTAIGLAIVACQSFWLLPVLDARIEAVIAGQPLPPTMHHMLYALLEAAKAAALAAIGVVALLRLARGGKAEGAAP